MGEALYVWDRRERHAKFQSTTLDGRDNREDIGNNMMIILKYKEERNGVKMWMDSSVSLINKWWTLVKI